MGTDQKTKREELKSILKAISRFENGASIEDIGTQSGLGLELRTLQRRLATLKEQGKIKVSGDTRSTRYYLVNPVQLQPGFILREPSPEYHSPVQLSEESKKIISYLSLPEHDRKPVAYNKKFLEEYIPNKNNYLTKEEKEKLAIIGKTVSNDQPAGTYAKQVLHRLLIDLSWNSSRLEGNTYSLLDTERLIAMGEEADHKSVIEAQMIINHKDAIEFIVQGKEDIGFNRYTILNLHAMLSNNLLPKPEGSGRLRNFAVGITKSVYIPLAIPQQIEAMFELLLQKAAQIKDPFEQAFFAMVHIPYLQPFEDVNKRVSRIAANIPLNRFNLSPLSFTDVPSHLYTQGIMGVYELNQVNLLKDIFLWAYERSANGYAAVRQIIGEPDRFKMKYREEIRKLIYEIVSSALPGKQASAKISAMANMFPEADRNKFIEVVDTEILSLHEGNFARYWIRPAEFKRWQELWQIRK
jgi:hypothetical protein